MKKLLLALLATSSFCAIAEPYVGLEYGFGTSNHDFQPRVGSAPNTRTLDPDMEDGIFTGFVGYNFTNKLGIELGYSQFDLSDDQSSGERIVEQTIEEDKWNADIKTKSVFVVGTYTHQLADKLIAKAKGGLIYTHYDATSGSFTERETLTDVDLPATNIMAGPAEKTDKIGGIIALGAEYFVIPQVSIGANVKYQFDSFAQTASANLGATYYFK